ncbi:hypothetical protein WSK_1941 [Novosphingobium sp. Rr 2-17]|uniref:hypothetical protein n=1 Tax=Novosphingobium sp. Rr 2-17 TaxID=555793 RepID=UPI00026981CD|nr:hypothetical protein [Novosphingobium sp. Rr 2-17]EIZ79479.1 hypothetical protein WSK_1941 [Novosphingobium sp. Rr 2-17]
MKKHSPTCLQSKPRSRFGLTVALAAGATVATAHPVVAQEQPDLSGLWVVTGYAHAIKTSEGKSPPLLPAPAGIYAKRRASLAKGDISYDSVAARCTPPGMPRIMTIPYAFQIIQTPKRIAFLFEWNRLYRRVDLDGPSRAADDLQFTGRSSGHWDHGSLVIDTARIDETLLDDAGMPHSRDLKMNEHFRLRQDGTLENRMQFDDPKTFRTPWETVVTYRRLPVGTRLTENICLDRLRTSQAIEKDHFLTYPR